MRPKQFSTKEWFDTVLHWFAPKGQDVLEVYATDPKTGEKNTNKNPTMNCRLGLLIIQSSVKETIWKKKLRWKY